MERTKDIEIHRAHWQDIAERNGWNTNPLYVQVWVDDEGYITDSVSFKGMTNDIYVSDEERQWS